MNHQQIDKIQKVIDDHRKEMYVTCGENCPCWKFQDIITEWKKKHNKNVKVENEPRLSRMEI